MARLVGSKGGRLRVHDVFLKYERYDELPGRRAAGASTMSTIT